MERTFDDETAREILKRRNVKHAAERNDAVNHNLSGIELARLTSWEFRGWCAGCTCAAAPRPCTVLDPFAGSGTVGVVCSKLGRDFIGIELNPEYAAMAERRIGAAPLSLFAAPTEDGA